MSEQYERKTYFCNKPSNFPVSMLARITQEPELRFTPSGIAVANLNVVVARSYQQDNEWKEKATFYKFSIWREAAERAVATMHKGDIVNIQFHLSDVQANAYEAKDGTHKASLECPALGVRKVASSTENGASGEYEPAPATEEDIPF
jgi:single-strand DNA-binding protein